MKRLLGLIVGVLILGGCAKNSPDIANPAFAPDISAVPGNFIQKVLLERFTMSSCGQCPKADVYVDSLMKLYPNRFYAASIHVDDMMEAATNLSADSTNILDSMFNTLSVYPGGILNRHNYVPSDFAIDNWFTNTQSLVSQVPSCGLALEAKEIGSNNHLRLVVHAGFSQAMAGDYRLHGYIIENTVYSNDSAYDQLNDFSFEGATPDTNLHTLYSLNDTVHLYKHKYVLKKIITVNGAVGDQIPQAIMTRGNEYVKVYDVDLTGINTSSSHIIFFVDKYGDTPVSHWIENVQKVNIGESKDWN
ncbi:MAG: Omp28-related outer membrane protein [Bacteroidia bacterium]